MANDEFFNLIKMVVYNQETIDLFKDVMGQVFKENQISHNQRSNQIKAEMDKLRQRLNKAQQLMLDSEMRLDEYRELKYTIEPEIDCMTREYMQLGVRDSDYKKYLDFGYNILKNLTYYWEEGDVTTKQALLVRFFQKNWFLRTMLIELHR